MIFQEPTDPRDEELAQAAAVWFARMNSDQVTEAERTAFHHWLEQHPKHRKAYGEIKSLWADLAGVADPRPEKKSSSVPQPLNQNSAPRSTPVFSGRVRWGALAACLLFAFWTALGGLETISWRLQADYRTALGETRVVTLPDGSRVHLNTDTAVAVDFDAGHRRVRLFGGEAFFDVVPDPARPFEVAAGDGIARVTGTRFNVREQDQKVTVTVVSGSVEVLKNKTVELRTPTVMLRPGQAAHYQPRQPKISTSPADEKEAISWRDGKLFFTDRPLREVVAELERYRRGSILLLDTDIAERRFTGVIDLSRIDPALEVIEETLPARVIHISDYLVVILPQG